MCSLVSAPPERLEPWLRHVRELADEVVLSVDASAGPGTLELARRHADHVAVVDLGGLPNRGYGWTAERATGDWILALDDDEILAPSFVERLPSLLEERVTHHHLPVRWVVPGPGGELCWIREFPWYPNHATRLFRNLAGLYRHPPQLHGVWEVLGEGRAQPAANDAIIHLNLALFGRPERERKIERSYRSRAVAGVPSCEEYYLYEDYGELELVPLADAAVARAMVEARPAPPSGERLAQRPSADAASLDAHAADRAPDPPIWSALYLAHDTPARLGTNRGHTVTLRVRNTSAGTWRSRGDVHGRVVISYRWRTLDGTLAVPQGDITLLPEALVPGGEAELVAGLWTPAEPGRYRLEWEALCERVAWFSDHGVPALVHEAEVVDVGPRPRAPHFPETHAPEPEPERPHQRAGPRSPLARRLRRARASK